jgi:UDP-glucose 4-epimerase
MGSQHDHPGHRRRGYIDSDTVHALLEAGEQVVVLDNLTTDFTRERS